MNSTHKVEVVDVKLEPHNNADSLSVVWVYGYTVVVKTADWQGITKAAYIPPDNLVKIQRSEFSWLAEKANTEGLCRIKAMKLRGVLSFGLLIPIADTFNVGDDVTEYLEVTHYTPKVKGNNSTGKHNFLGGCEEDKAPNVYSPKYDLEAFRRYAKNMFIPDEHVIVTEKIHGCLARFTYHDGRMYCGSKSCWKAEFPSYKHITLEYLLEKECTEEKANEILERLKNKEVKKNLWWRALDETKGLKDFCMNFPNYTLYGEIYGNVQDLKYGCEGTDIKFAAFDLRDSEGKWLDWGIAKFLLNMYSIPMVPLLNEIETYNQQIIPIKFDFDKICALAEGKSFLTADHVREGVVVRSFKESVSNTGFRRVLKCVGEGYYNRKGEQESLVSEDE